MKRYMLAIVGYACSNKYVSQTLFKFWRKRQ